MNDRSPEELRRKAKAIRQTAMASLGDADSLDIVANVLDRWTMASVELVVADARADRASESGSESEIEAAENDRLAAEVDIAVTEAIIDDPLSLESFTGCQAWAARISRPEVYRRILIAYAEGKAVSEYAYAAAVIAAQTAIGLDSGLLAGQVAEVGAP